MDASSIVQLCCMLVIWLNLKAGVSRKTANIILMALHFIINTTFQLLQVTLTSNFGININLPKIHIPQDVRTAYQTLDHEPEIIRTACCPSCYQIYSGPIPWHCSWKASPRSKVCNAELWRLQNFGHVSRWVPRTLYNTQDFKSWLQFFLNRREIDNHLENTFHRIPAAYGTDMHDVQDSPAWRGLQDFLSHRYHLVFGLYIDWFNPYTNKIAGMLWNLIMYGRLTYL